MNTPIRIIYILSVAHSGSTLLDVILGSHSRIESGGEISKFWAYFSDHSTRPEEKRICTCGVHVKKCAYWARVRNRLNECVIDLESSDGKEFEDNNHDLIKAILRVSGKEIFCDSSKNYVRLKRLLDSDLFNVCVVHLVRDGRAVAYSHKRKGDRVGIQEPQYDYYRVLSHWQENNIRCYLELKNHPYYICVKYEDLVDDPRKQISRILEKGGLKFESDQLQFWRFDHHNLSGNRMRIRGEQEIKRDTLYLESLSRKEWWLGTISVLSGLRHFGYPMFRE